jgi:Transposase IS200 like
LGVLGRAQDLFGMRICAVTVLSNHLHALLIVNDAAQLASFMQHILANIAKEVGRHHQWHGPFWSRRYRSIVVADAHSQAARLQYVLCQGLKEGLVDRIDRWPGVSSFRCLTRGIPLSGTWYDRTAEFEARRRGRGPDPSRTEKAYQVTLSQVPILADKSPKEYQAFIGALVREEEDGVARERAHDGKTAVLGVRRILEQEPHAAPEESGQSPAPFVHAASVAVRSAFKAAYRAFVDAFKTAATCLRAGSAADFPEGAFPPPAPFVEPRRPPT